MLYLRAPEGRIVAPAAVAEQPAGAHQGTGTREVESPYHDGLRLLDAGHWRQALEGLSRLAPSYRDTAALLARARKELATLTHGNRVWAVSFSPDGRRLATAGRDRSARIWSLLHDSDA